MKRLKEKLSLTAVCKIVPTVIFLIFIGVVMIKSLPGEVLGNIKDTPPSPSGLASFADGFEEVLQDSIYLKYSFIDLNGLAARLLGQNSLNGRQKMANGSLQRFMYPTDPEVIDGLADRTGELKRFLDGRGIEFLYVLAPNKSTVYDAEFAPGYDAKCEADIDNMIRALKERGVDTLDMNAWFEQNGWRSEDILFKTDHHWRPEAALQAARATMEYLEGNGISGYNRDYFSDGAWQVEVWENHFLGSDGKRVGTLYAGLDSISVYKPRFQTDYRYSRLSRTDGSWIYSDSLLDESYKYSREYHTDNPYYAYMHDDAPIRITENSLGANGQRILIIGDSFKVTYEYFMTAQFKEVYTVDLRYYTDGTLAQAVDEIKPDTVLMCISFFTADKAFHEFGVGE